MPLPSREQTFGYENCRDLVKKLDREIDRYCEVAGSEISEAGEALLKCVLQLEDSAFNAAVTAWHLCDWVFKEFDDTQRQKFEFKKLADLQNYVRRECRVLHLCRQAATASKHWVVEKHADPTVKTVVSGERGWTIYFEDNGKKIAADQVFIEARNFWDKFIRDNGIPKPTDDEMEALSVILNAPSDLEQR
jgi:hypothetical protein